MKPVDETAAPVSPASVVEVLSDGRIRVSLLGDQPDLVCVTLQSLDAPSPALLAGDEVLVVVPPGSATGIILGRLAAKPALPVPVAEELVLEATKQVTLRCGESSITLRADGKILIQGKDVVSHAKRMNRIKGGAVSIN